MPYCRNCGTKLAEDVLYCYNCGAAVNQASCVATSMIQQKNATYEKASSKPIMHPNVLFILILLTLIVTVLSIVIVAASLSSSINFGINGQPSFGQPGITRVNWSTPENIKHIFIIDKHQ